ncbi:thioredoxin-like protein [Coemansia spiralis]|nr:thioredoxin-like protein [Coemansia spiralis]
MNFKKILLGVLCATLGQVFAQAAPVGAKTHVLDKNNFEAKTSQGAWIVKHFSPTCSHCQSFQPKWEQAVSERSVQVYDQNVHFGEVNCYENTMLCERNKVVGWPTVVAFRGGKRIADLEGDKSKQDVLDFIDHIVSEAQMEAAATDGKANGVWLVKHYSPLCPHCRDMAPEWTKMTDELAGSMAKQGILFGQVNCLENRKLCEDNFVDGYPTINLFVNGKFIEEMVAKYTYDDMKAYALKIPERHKRGELNKNPEPVVANDNRDWDDMADDTAGKQGEASVKDANAAINTLAEKPNADNAAAGDSHELNNGDKSDHSAYNTEGEVVALTKENFAEKTATGPWFVKFYAPWCPHCQHLAPIWEKLADAAKGKINIGKVNCDEAGLLCSKHGVQAYPTLKMMWESETSDYKGSRDLENLLDFVDRMLAQPANVQTIDEVRQTQKEHEVVFVFAHEKSDTSARTTAALTQIKANAKKLFLSKQVNIISSLELARQVLPDYYQSLPALAALKDNKVIKFNGTLTNDDQLREFFYAERFSLLPELTRENSDALFYDSDYLVLAVLDSTQGAEYMKHYRDVVRSAAISHQQGNKAGPSVRFTWVDGIKWEGYIDRVFRIRRSNWPAIIIAQPSEDRYYVSDVKGQPIEPSKMGVFMAVRDALNGKLRAESSKSIIVRGAHGIFWAIKSAWLFMFGTMLRTLVSLSTIAAFVYYSFKRGKKGSSAGIGNLVKAD